MAKPRKWIRNLAELAEDQGWVVEQTKKNHYRFKAPDGQHMVHTSGTPSDWRSLKNTAAQLRRAGLVIPETFALAA